MRSMSLPPPGQSEFHVKGVIYLGTHRYFEREVPGGLETLWANIDDPALRAFMQQRFLAASWYDVLPIAQLIRCEARAVGQSVAQYMRGRAAYQAQEDLRGVYKWVLSIVSPEQVAIRLPRVAMQVFDFGTTEAESLAPAHVRLALRGFPTSLAEWYTNALEVYARTALEIAGATDVRTTLWQSRERTRRGNVELLDLEGELRWRTK